jgi:hypothetical protein
VASVHNTFIDVQKVTDADRDKLARELHREIARRDADLRGTLRYILAGSIKDRLVGVVLLGAGIVFGLIGSILGTSVDGPPCPLASRPMDEAFNSTYYATAAQVIPIFFLAAAAPRFLGHGEDARPGYGLMLLSVVLFAGWGEMTALNALHDHEDPSSVGQSVVNLAVWLPLVLVGSMLIARPIATLVGASPRWAVNAVAIGITVLLVAILLGFTSVAAYFEFGLLLTPLVFGFVRMMRSQPADDKPD